MYPYLVLWLRYSTVILFPLLIFSIFIRFYTVSCTCSLLNAPGAWRMFAIRQCVRIINNIEDFIHLSFHFSLFSMYRHPDWPMKWTKNLFHGSVNKASFDLSSLFMLASKFLGKFAHIAQTGPIMLIWPSSSAKSSGCFSRCYNWGIVNRCVVATELVYID